MGKRIDKRAYIEQAMKDDSIITVGWKLLKDKVKICLTCDRCFGAGYFNDIRYKIADGGAGRCFKCWGNRFFREVISIEKAYNRIKAQERANVKRAAKLIKIEKRVKAQIKKDKEIAIARSISSGAVEVLQGWLKSARSHLGTIGKREEFELRYEAQIPFTRRSYSGYGTETCFIHIFRDASKSKAVWFSPSCPDMDAEGQLVKVKATVKDHGERDGEAQTVFQRVNFI